MSDKVYKFYLWGASDDLIELSGDVGGADEFGASYDRWKYLRFSNGLYVRIKYGDTTDGVWKIEVLEACKDSHNLYCGINDEQESAGEEGHGLDAFSSYSDVLYVASNEKVSLVKISGKPIKLVGKNYKKARDIMIFMKCNMQNVYDCDTDEQLIEDFEKFLDNYECK